MRKLQTKDIFASLRLIQKAGVKEELKPLINMAANGEMKVEAIGVEGVLTMLEIFSASKSEAAIYEFLAGPFEVSQKDVEEMELDVLIAHIQRLAEENNLRSFFTALQGLITKK